MKVERFFINEELGVGYSHTANAQRLPIQVTVPTSTRINLTWDDILDLNTKCLTLDQRH